MQLVFGRGIDAFLADQDAPNRPAMVTDTAKLPHSHEDLNTNNASSDSSNT